MTRSDFQKVSAVFLDATRPGGYAQAMCHFPVYGLRFFRGDDLLVETSVCFLCNNFYAPSKTGEYDWESLSDSSPKLRAILESFIPIPKDVALPDWNHLNQDGK